MFDFTKKIPMRGFMQEGTAYNRELHRDSNILYVERMNTNAQEPWFTKYEKKSFLGVKYWSFVCWFSEDQEPTPHIGKSLFKEN